MGHGSVDLGASQEPVNAQTHSSDKNLIKSHGQAAVTAHYNTYCVTEVKVCVRMCVCLPKGEIWLK